MSYNFANQLLASQEFFERSTRVLDEGDSNFRPQADMMTAAQQVGHVAQTLDWFIEGASRPEGFDLDFAAHAAALQDLKSLAAAREMLKKAYGKENEAYAKAMRSAPVPKGTMMFFRSQCPSGWKQAPELTQQGLRQRSADGALDRDHECSTEGTSQPRSAAEYPARLAKVLD